MRKFSVVMRVAVMFSCALARSLQVTTTKRPPVSTRGNCDPNIDMVFMLNGRSTLLEENFQRQRKFVRDIVGNHNSPTGTVHIGFVVCSENNATSIPFQTTKTNIMTSLDILKRSNSVYHTSEKIDCIENVYRLFRQSNRPHASKLALLIIGDESRWSQQHADSLSKEAEINHISLLVIGIGIRNFLKLHSLQSIASKTSSLFVLASYLELRHLSAEFSSGSCLPISFSMISLQASSTIAPKTTTLPGQVRCRVVGDGKKYLKEVPFLGWQRRSCKEDKIVDVFSCTCVKRKQVQMLNDNQAPNLTKQSNSEKSNVEILVKRKINVSKIGQIVRSGFITAEFKSTRDFRQVGNFSAIQSKHLPHRKKNTSTNESMVTSDEAYMIRQTPTYSVTTEPQLLPTTSHALMRATTASTTSTSHFTPTLTNEYTRALSISTNSLLHFYNNSAIESISSNSITANTTFRNFTTAKSSVTFHSSNIDTGSKLTFHSSNIDIGSKLTFHSSNIDTGSKLTLHLLNSSSVDNVPLYSSNSTSMSNVHSYSSNSSSVNNVHSYSSNSSSVNNVHSYSSNSSSVNNVHSYSSNSSSVNNVHSYSSNSSSVNNVHSYSSNSSSVNNVHSYSSNSSSVNNVPSYLLNSSSVNNVSSYSSNSSSVNNVPLYSSNSSSVNNWSSYSSNSSTSNVTLGLSNSRENNMVLLSSNFDNANNAALHPSISSAVTNITSPSSNKMTSLSSVSNAANNVTLHLSNTKTKQKTYT